MWYPASVIKPPPIEPITVAEVMAQTIIDHDDDERLIGRLIETARSHVEAYCNLILARQTIAVRCDAFSDFARLPVAPVREIETIGYVDAAGGEQTLPGTVYELRADDVEVSIGLKAGQCWPAIRAGSRITVTVLAGYAEVPPAIKHAMLLWIADNYSMRGNAPVGGFSAFDALLCNFRRGA